VFAGKSPLERDDSNLSQRISLINNSYSEPCFLSLQRANQIRTVPFSGDSDEEEEEEEDEECSEDGHAFAEDVVDVDEDGDEEEEEDARVSASNIVGGVNSASDTGRGTSSRNTTTSSTSAGDVSLTSPRAAVARPSGGGGVDAFKFPNHRRQPSGGGTSSNMTNHSSLSERKGAYKTYVHKIS